MDKNKCWVNLMNMGMKLGCHQMPERSFFYKGYQFPVCARCTGVLISTFAAMIVFFKKKIPVKHCIALSGVMLLDWGLQFLKIKESTNKRRLITGLIGGFGVASLHMYFYNFVFNILFRRNKKRN